MSKVRLHTTITKLTDEKIKKLCNRYGTRSKVIENAIAVLEKSETVGTCDECPLKEENSFRIILDLVSLREEMLKNLIRILCGELDFQTFFKGIRERAKEEAYLFNQAFTVKKRNDFQSLLEYLKIWEKLSNHISILQVFERENVILMRVKTFHNIPEIVIEIIRGHLEGMEITFELDLGLDNLLKIKWVSSELARFSKVKKEMDKKLELRYGELCKKFQTYPLHHEMVPVSRGIFNYLIEQTSTKMLPIDLIMDEIEKIPNLNIKENYNKNELEAVRKILTYFENLNYLTITNISSENNKILTSFKYSTEPVMYFLVQMISIIFSRLLLKLIEFNLEHDIVNITYEKVKREDQNVLNEILKYYVLDDISRELIPMISIPRHLLQKLNNEVYTKNLEDFKEIYRILGIEIANAVAIYCQQRNLIFDEIVIEWLIQYLGSKDRIVDQENKIINIYYLSTNRPAIESDLFLVEGLLSRISKKVSIEHFENMLTIKFKLKN